MATEAVNTSTGVVYITGSIGSFTSTGTISETNNNLITTSTDGIVLQNNTASTAGVPVQISPRLRFRSHVWNTTPVAADNTDDWWLESVPVSGATPSGLLRIASSLNGGAATYPLQVNSSGQLLVLDGTAALPNVAFANLTNTGMYLHNAAANRIGWASAGAGQMSLDNGTGLALRSSLAFGWTTTGFDPTNLTTILSQESAAVLQFGLDGAGVTNQMIKGPDRITSDGVGGNLTIAGGRNRGASAGGSVIFQTAPAAGAGVTGTLADRMTIDSTGNVGIGTTAPDARLEINHATGDNLRLTYNDADGSAANYTDFSLGATGDLTITSSASSIKFNGMVGPTANDGAPLGSASVSWADLYLASGGIVNWADSDVTLTHAANSLTFAGGVLSIDSQPIQFITSGVAITAGNYQIGRDADATNQMHFNVPTGAGFEWSVNDVAQFTLSNAGVGIFQGRVDASFFSATAGRYDFGVNVGSQRSDADAKFHWQNNVADAGVGFDFTTDALLKVRTRAQTGYASVDALAYQINGAGNATSADKKIKKVTAIADNVATDVLTVTVPNANHAAAIKLTFVSSNGSTDAFESSRTAEGLVVLARTTGVATVATATALEAAGIATVAGGATHTLAYGVSAMTGAVSTTQTFTVQVTIDDSGNLGSNQVVVLAEVINAEATGVTIA